jgi:hypothetical protein
MVISLPSMTHNERLQKVGIWREEQAESEDSTPIHDRQHKGQIGLL